MSVKGAGEETCLNFILSSVVIFSSACNKRRRTSDCVSEKKEEESERGKMHNLASESILSFHFVPGHSRWLFLYRYPYSYPPISPTIIFKHIIKVLFPKKLK